MILPCLLGTERQLKLSRYIFISLAICIIPFWFLLTLFSYAFFESAIVSTIFSVFKEIAFLFVPLLFLILLFINKYKYKVAFPILLLCLYLFFISSLFYFNFDFSKEAIVSFRQSTISFLLILLGYLLSLNKEKIVLLLKLYLNVTFLFSVAGFILYFLFLYCDYLPVGSKNYLIESVNMRENQFIGELSASNYSFLFHDKLGLIIRWFSPFYSAIGAAYFLGYALLVIFFLYRGGYTNKLRYLLLLLFLSAFVLTFTRGAWISLFIAIFLTVLLAAKNKNKNKIKLFLFIFLSFLILSYAEVFFKLLSGIETYQFDIKYQSSAAHIYSLLSVLDAHILNHEFAFGNVEGYLNDMLFNFGVLPFAAFIIVSYTILNSLINKYKQTKNTIYLISISFLIFNIVAGIFSQETFTFIVSYFSWIHIGITLSNQSIMSQCRMQKNIKNIFGCS